LPHAPPPHTATPPPPYLLPHVAARVEGKHVEAVVGAKDGGVAAGVERAGRELAHPLVVAEVKALQLAAVGVVEHHLRVGGWGVGGLWDAVKAMQGRQAGSCSSPGRRGSHHLENSKRANS